MFTRLWQIMNPEALEFYIDVLEGYGKFPATTYPYQARARVHVPCVCVVMQRSCVHSCIRLRFRERTQPCLLISRAGVGAQ